MPRYKNPLQAIRDLTPEDREAVYRYGMQRSEEILSKIYSLPPGSIDRFVPIIKDENGTPRYRANKVIEWIVQSHPTMGSLFHGLNTLSFPVEDLVEFYKLCGHSVCFIQEVFDDKHPEVAARIEREEEAWREQLAKIKEGDPPMKHKEAAEPGSTGKTEQVTITTDRFGNHFVPWNGQIFKLVEVDLKRPVRITDPELRALFNFEVAKEALIVAWGRLLDDFHGYHKYKLHPDTPATEMDNEYADICLSLVPDTTTQEYATADDCPLPIQLYYTYVLYDTGDRYLRALNVDKLHPDWEGIWSLAFNARNISLSDIPKKKT